MINVSDRLLAEVAKALILSEAMGLANKGVQVDNPNVVAMYAAILAAEGIAPEDVEAALPDMFAGEEYFPRPAVLARYAGARRDERLAAERERFYGSLVIAADAEGREVLAPRERVRLGRLLPPGDMSGDGSEAPSLPARSGSAGTPSEAMADGKSRAAAARAARSEAMDAPEDWEAKREQFRRHFLRVAG